MFDIWKPEIFHGRRKEKNFFEGWYFKVVDHSEKNACAVIPGVSITGDPSKSHAFVMFLDARAQRMRYFRYPLDELKASDKKFELSIGGSFFSSERMNLTLGQGRGLITARISFKGTYPWPVKLLSPGVMGWYAFVPGMECYHGILSMDHSIEGFIEVDGIRTDFTGGKGYIEKDWGVSMPSSWIWMQTNHFDEPEASFTGSIARIPWMGGFFTGFLFGLYLKGQVYRLATYRGAKVRNLALKGDEITFSVEDSRYGLEVSGHRARGARLLAPRMGGMTVRIDETLDSEISLCFYRRQGREVIFSGTGRHAGLEYVGSVGELMQGLR